MNISIFILKFIYIIYSHVNKSIIIIYIKLSNHFVNSKYEHKIKQAKFISILKFKFIIIFLLFIIIISLLLVV